MNDLACANYSEDIVASGVDTEGWLETTIKPPTAQDDDAVLIDEDMGTHDVSTKIEKPSKDAAYIDMEDDDLHYDDDHTRVTDVVRLRRYDVSITYDNYYRTPRIWLYGYNENGSPLSAEEMFEDTMQDYAQKTVTVDPHPHLNQYHASVHPCRHSAADGKTMVVEQYLFMFLKFIQTVVPTIEYDYTIEVTANGKE